MKKVLCALIFAVCGTACAQSIWDVSPLAWDNSPLKWENSPLNWDNSIVGSQSGLYDGAGRQIGYATNAPSGATNVYLNNGHRIGYVPPNEDRAIRFDSLSEIDSLPVRRSGSLDVPVSQTRQVRKSAIRDEDFDFPPPRRVPAPVKPGFTPLDPPMKSGFTPLPSGFTPIKSGFTPLGD